MAAIPKVIHYCWFGYARKTKLVRNCIASWKTQLPDYDIIEWNEENSDLTTSFVSEAYRLKKWAFVADFIRLKVLYEYGGIYLDTDMMVIKPLDFLLTHDSFFGAEDYKYINCAIIGTSRNNEFIKKCLSQYEFLDKKPILNWGHISIPKIVTDVFRREYNFFNPFDKVIQVENIVIYPRDWFYPLPFENKADNKNFKNYIKEDTYAIHLWASSWIEYSEFHYLRNKQYAKGFWMVFKNIFLKGKISVSYFRKIASCIKESIKK
jgi:mannosyltransferase OCH1-like enzyme